MLRRVLSIRKTRLAVLLTGTASALVLGACGVKTPSGELDGLPGAAIGFERWSAKLERKEIQVNGETIAYLDGGQGDPLILIHGFGGSKDNFDRVAKQLTPHMRVIALDLPGFGASTKRMDGDYSIEKQALRVHEFAKAMGLNTFHLGGNSMGGWISGVYASRYPEQVQSVWFLAPAGISASRQSQVAQEFAKTGNILLTASNRQEYERIIDIVFHKRPALMPGFVLDAMAARAAADQPLHNRIYRDMKTGYVEMDKQIAASGYKNPALIVWGDDDRVLDVAGAAELAKALPQAKTIIMKDMGHVPMMERPDDVAKDYLKFRGITG